MASSALQSLQVLESALSDLKQQTSGSLNPLNNAQLISAARAVLLAADDAEFVATESKDASFRKTLSEKVSAARTAATNARTLARNAALNVKRQDLLSSADSQSDEKDKNNMNDASRVAAQINDGLRRTTAIVAEEINRSRATANVLDHSSRRLRSTRDQHKSFGSSLQSGSKTLTELKRSERIANIAIVICVFFFFLTAAHVAKKRITDGNVANFIVKPAFNAFSAPFRVVSGIAGISGRSSSTISKSREEPGRAKTSNRASEVGSHEAEKLYQKQDEGERVHVDRDEEVVPDLPKEKDKLTEINEGEKMYQEKAAEDKADLKQVVTEIPEDSIVGTEKIETEKVVKKEDKVVSDKADDAMSDVSDDIKEDRENPREEHDKAEQDRNAVGDNNEIVDNISEISEDESKVKQEL